MMTCIELHNRDCQEIVVAKKERKVIREGVSL